MRRRATPRVPVALNTEEDRLSGSSQHVGWSQEDIATFFEVNRPRLMRRAKRLLGSGNHADAENLLQDVCVKVLAKHEHISANLNGYILTAMSNRAIDLGLQGSIFDRYAPKFLPDRTSNLDWTVQIEDEVLLKGALNRLKERYRFVLFSYYYQDLSVAQIAQRLNNSPEKVNDWLKKARAALEKELERGAR